MSDPTVVIFKRDSISGRTQFHLPDIRVIFKMFPESLYFWEIQNNTIIYAYFHLNNPLVQLRTSASDYKVVENIPGNHFESLFSFSVAFLTSVSSQKCRPFNADFSRDETYVPTEGRSGEQSGFLSIILKWNKICNPFDTTIFFLFQIK